MLNDTLKNDLVVNDLIKIIYKYDNGKTVKNALVSKSPTKARAEKSGK